MTSTNRTASRKQVRARRDMMGYRPLLEYLEDRITPSAIHWLGSPATGGELWNVASNWQENRVPVSGDDVIFDTTTAGF